MADVLVHRGQRGYDRSGPDRDPAQLAVGLEGPSEAVMPSATVEGVEEREAILADPLGQDDRGGAFGELDEVHDEDHEEGVLGAASRLDEADDGGYVAGTVDAG